MDKVADAPRPVGVLVVSDGKAGHLNQSLGLTDALQRLRPELRVGTCAPLRVPALLRRRFTAVDADAPALLVGAGHGTHATLLGLRRANRSRAIVLMRPSLPRRLFDLCIEPEHDGGRESARCWLSRGPLNRMRPGGSPRDRGLILLGGPSPHFHWDREQLVAQIARVCDGRRKWTLSDSRRTPEGTLEALAALQLPGLEILPLAEQPQGWLAAQLPAVQRCWISPDSASMVYEALSAGCAVGAFDLPVQSGSRVARGIEQLVEEGLVAMPDASDPAPELPQPGPALAEADRMARRIAELGWL